MRVSSVGGAAQHCLAHRQQGAASSTKVCSHVIRLACSQRHQNPLCSVTTCMRGRNAGSCTQQHGQHTMMDMEEHARACTGKHVSP